MLVSCRFQLAIVGECQFKGEDCIVNIPCYMDRKPVCADDGNTYHNECAMRKHACKQKRAKVAVKSGIDCSRYLKYSSLYHHLMQSLNRNDRAMSHASHQISVTRLLNSEVYFKILRH